MQGGDVPRRQVVIDDDTPRHQVVIDDDAPRQRLMTDNDAPRQRLTTDNDAPRQQPATGEVCEGLCLRLHQQVEIREERSRQQLVIDGDLTCL